MASATRRRRRSLVLLAAVVITVMMLPASPATAWPTNPTCTQYNEGQVIRLQYEDTWVEYECREVLQPDYTFGFQWVVRDVGNVRDEDGTHLSDWEDAAYVALLQGFTGKSAGGGIFGVHYSLR
ncbi:MAG TPA: hypothetical protein VK891_11060, partial [Euzebyales bacterium]|nr:hypothetical protein [Euzebyales bacterium]